MLPYGSKAGMSYLSADERELFLPLSEGIHDNPPWGTFLRNLVARTNSRRAMMIVRLAKAMPSQPPFVCHAAAPRAAGEPLLAVEQLRQLDLHPYGSLRPGRVYALDEMLDYDDADIL